MLTWANSLMAKSITRNNMFFFSVKIKNERSKLRFYKYFGLFPETINGHRKETKILVETNFRSFVFYFNIQKKCCFWLYPLPFLCIINKFSFFFVLSSDTVNGLVTGHCEFFLVYCDVLYSYVLYL